MSTPRRVKLFRNGRKQAGHEALIDKEGERLVLGPPPRVSLLQVLSTLSPLEEELPAAEDAPPDPVDL